MLKLYKSNYTHDELLAMATHVRNFCACGYGKTNKPCAKPCMFYRICRDFNRLADYCMEKVNNREYSDC